MARQPAGPARQRNVDLIRELERIARQKELTVHGRVDYRALSLRSGLSESGLDGIVKRNVVPDAMTLVKVARFAGESPLWLFLAAHWIGFALAVAEARERRTVSSNHGLSAMVSSANVGRGAGSGQGVEGRERGWAAFGTMRPRSHRPGGKRLFAWGLGCGPWRRRG